MNYKKAYIYEIINNINKKTYVGQHKSKTEKDNYFGSGTVLNQAFDKYGKENFSITQKQNAFTIKKYFKNSKIHFPRTFRS